MLNHLIQHFLLYWEAFRPVRGACMVRQLARRLFYPPWHGSQTRSAMSGAACRLHPGKLQEIRPGAEGKTSKCKSARNENFHDFLHCHLDFLLRMDIMIIEEMNVQDILHNVPIWSGGIWNDVDSAGCFGLCGGAVREGTV